MSKSKIVGRLLTAQEASTASGGQNHSQGGNYSQSGGSYTQSSGGSHWQSGSGGYTQSVPKPIEVIENGTHSDGHGVSVRTETPPVHRSFFFRVPQPRVRACPSPWS
jgi:hypothetical protein